MPKKPSKKKASRDLTDIEKEIIRADIAFLKQQEIDNGDRAKWEKSQEIFNPRRVTLPRRSSNLDGPLVAGQITRQIYWQRVGRIPEQNDLDRANCTEEGTIGHRSCGWCSTCDKPRFMCGHERIR
jgi:hypothetical protein